MSPDDPAGNPSNSPTLSMAATQQGVILGTAAYMSPEQAKGRTVDKRTDVFAFGCVLYECLTGKPAFDGESITETLAATIHIEPDWTALPVDIPPHVVRQLQRCFEKDPKRRTRDMGDVALELAAVPIEESAPDRASSGMRWGWTVPLILLVVIASYIAGTWRTTPGTSTTTNWIGERLGGPPVAWLPTVSPDGTRVAFLVMDDGLSQVGVMQPGSGGSRQLTFDRNRGTASELAWSPDSSRIFFSTFGTDASNVYSISVVGDVDERTVLEDARTPRPLDDGSLLAVITNDERIPQLIRFRPETGDVDRLPVLLTGALIEQAISVVPGGREAVVFGRPESEPESANHLYVVDLETYDLRRIAPEITMPPLIWNFPLSVTPDEVYFDLPIGDLHEIVAVELDGSPGFRSVRSLTRKPLAIDVASDGALYLDQISQAHELLRIDPGTNMIERFDLATDFAFLLPLPDDRYLVSQRAGSRDRLMVVKSGEAPSPFLETDEEARGPLALVGDGAVAFMIGPVGRQVLALASFEGQMQGRIQIPNEAEVTGLTASQDGTTL